MKLNSTWRKTFLNEHHLNTVQPLWTLINKGIFYDEKINSPDLKI